MRRTLFSLGAVGLIGMLIAAPALPQAAGNRNSNPNPNAGGNPVPERRYPTGYGNVSAEQVVNEQPNLLVNTYQFIDVRLLTSLPTTTYVAVFGLNQEAGKVEEANKRLQDQIAALRVSLTALGVRPDDMYLDFITQTRTYDYQVKDNVAKEKMAGYQIKENLYIRYRDRALLDRIVPVAAQHGVFDLIKVDYQTEDLGPVRDRMLEEAQKVIKKKEEAYTKLGIKLTPVSVTSEAFEAFQPVDAYNAYRAFETGTADDNYRVVERRKSSTLYFDPLDPMKFDVVLTPVGFEPQVQCTYFLRVKYLVGSHTTVIPKPEDRKP